MESASGPLGTRSLALFCCICPFSSIARRSCGACRYRTLDCSRSSFTFPVLGALLRISLLLPLVGSDPWAAGASQPDQFPYGEQITDDVSQTADASSSVACAVVEPSACLLPPKEFESPYPPPIFSLSSFSHLFNLPHPRSILVFFHQQILLTCFCPIF